MSKYNTNQRKILVEYLAKHHDCVLSARRIAEDLESAEISVSAVYRNLAALEEEGAVRRCAKAGERAAYYQYIGTAACKNQIHLSCIRCGKTFHLPEEAADRLVDEITATEDFEVDKTETVLYGVCSDCHA